MACLSVSLRLEVLYGTSETTQQLGKAMGHGNSSLAVLNALGRWLWSHAISVITRHFTASIDSHGAASLWQSNDFKEWSYVHPLYTTSECTCMHGRCRRQIWCNFHSLLAAQYGMWECPDFFPIPNSPQTYALKYSAGGRDWYTLGTYDENKQVAISLKR